MSTLLVAPFDDPRRRVLTNGAGIARFRNFRYTCSVVRIYSALTNGASITRLDNTRAAAGQHALSTTRVVGYSLMVQASRVSVIFVILAAVVRIYRPH